VGKIVTSLPGGAKGSSLRKAKSAPEPSWLLPTTFPSTEAEVTDGWATEFIEARAAGGDNGDRAPRNAAAIAAKRLHNHVNITGDQELIEVVPAVI
jgi:hypothetical protein